MALLTLKESEDKCSETGKRYQMKSLSTPSEVVPGKSRCFLAHDERKKGQGVIFGFFVISGVEVILDDEGKIGKYQEAFLRFNGTRTLRKETSLVKALLSYILLHILQLPQGGFEDRLNQFKVQIVY